MIDSSMVVELFLIFAVFAIGLVVWVDAKEDEANDDDDS